jgi:hypothetical protein
VSVAHGNCGDGSGIDIFAHPRKPIYDPEGLNDFMFGLVTLTPTRLDYFHTIAQGFEQPTRRLALGRLCFDETVANTALAGRALAMSTSLRVFPDAGHLLDAVHGHNPYDIPVAELGQRANTPIIPEVVLAVSPRFLFI